MKKCIEHFKILLPAIGLVAFGIFGLPAISSDNAPPSQQPDSAIQTTPALHFSSEFIERYGKIPVEGVDYTVFSDRQLSPPTVNVLFWFGCGHCYDLESTIEKNWFGAVTKGRLGETPLSFTPVPQGSWKTHAELYSLLKLTGNQNLVNEVFTEIHVNKNSLSDKESIINYLASKNISRSTIMELYNNGNVKSEIDAYSSLAADMQVKSVPNLIINNKIKTSPLMVSKALVAAKFDPKNAKNKSVMLAHYIANNYQ